MRRAFIVRHGNTFAPGQAPHRIGSRTDVPLHDSGRDQARALARHFQARGIAFDRVLVSPLHRTRETAALIAPNVPHEAADWLREIDHGPDEGKPEAAVLARIGQGSLDAWEERGEPPPGWIVDADMRLAAWSAWLADPGAETTLLVTSNGAARFGRIALGLAPAKLRTGACAELAWDGGAPQFRSWDTRP